LTARMQRQPAGASAVTSGSIGAPEGSWTRHRTRCQHLSVSVSICQYLPAAVMEESQNSFGHVREHRRPGRFLDTTPDAPSANVSICQHLPASVSICQHLPAAVIKESQNSFGHVRQHRRPRGFLDMTPDAPSASVSICQHLSASVSIGSKTDSGQHPKGLVWLPLSCPRVCHAPNTLMPRS